MTSKIKDDIRISQMANGFVVETDTSSMFSKSDCYVFQTFELLLDWLWQYYLRDELKNVRHIRTNEAKPYILGGSDPE